MTVMFDMDLRALRRDRAARTGQDRFLIERAFEDCLERVGLVQRKFDSALLVGCPSNAWPERLRQFAQAVEVKDPGALFAQAAGGSLVVEDAWSPPSACYDLVLAIGTLDTVNDVPLALKIIQSALRPGGLFLGAMSGGDTVPQLRRAMQAADATTGAATPHVHPRVEASAVAPLLESCGFHMPVVDVDRVQVAYPSFGALIADLRRMAATNVLVQRSRRPLGPSAYRAAVAAFEGTGGRTIETFEILHFAAWTQNQH
jgi:SAM-dependent methyltransferase